MTLTAVKKAAANKRRSEDQYRAALLAAREAGHSYTVIAHAAGISRQAARQLIQRAR